MSRTLHSDEPDEAKSHQVLHQCNRGPCRYYTVLLTTAKTFRPFYDIPLDGADRSTSSHGSGTNS